MTPTTQNLALETWTPERQKQVNEATPESPVLLTPDEERELREANKNGFYLAIGEGCLMIHIREGSRAAQVLALKDKGMNTEAIAEQLGVSVTTIRRIMVAHAMQAQDAHIAEAIVMKASGKSNAEIGENLDLDESAVRKILES